MEKKIYVFKSGLRLVYQKVEMERPTSIKIGVYVGSKDEKAEENGISHFIEHLVFKGTKKRTNKQISADFEFIGANSNAFTATQKTCFYLTGLNEKFEESLEILSDIVFNPLFKQEDIDKERNVIYEEIDMYKDNPRAIVSQEVRRLFYGDTALGREVVGTKETLSKINRKEILNYYKEHYIAKNIIVSVVCGLDFNYVKKMVKKYVDAHFEGTDKPDEVIKSNVVVPDRNFTAIKKDVKQANVVFCFPCCNVFSKEKMATALLAFIFGGGMSSRLFTRVREDEGLVYDIYAEPICSLNGGALSVCFGANENNVKKTIKCIKEEILKLKENGVTEEELDRAKNFIKAMMLSGLEKTTALASKNMSQAYTRGKFVPLEEKIKMIEKVTIEKVKSVIDSVFNFSNVCGSVISKSLDASVFDDLQ